MPQETPKKIPARYIGGHAVRLPAGLGPFFNVDGSRRQSLLLETGQCLMMPEIEIIGQTYLFDPRGQKDPLHLGAGKRVLPEHADLDARELSIIGYEFHEGRPDFQALTPDEITAEIAALQPAKPEQPPQAPTNVAPPSSPESVAVPVAQQYIGG